MHTILGDEYIKSVKDYVFETLLRDMPKFSLPIWGEVRLQKLGPAHRQFKIVKLECGRRIIVDQDADVLEPIPKLRIHWLGIPIVKSPPHMLCVTTA